MRKQKRIPPIKEEFEVRTTARFPSPSGPAGNPCGSALKTPQQPQGPPPPQMLLPKSITPLNKRFPSLPPCSS